MKMQGVTNLAAGASNRNVLAGEVFEFVKRPGKARFYIVGDAAGAARASVKSGSETLLDESPISRANRVPVVPDDLTVEDVVMPGDRLQIGLRNTGAGAIDVFWAVEVTELR